MTRRDDSRAHSPILRFSGRKTPDRRNLRRAPKVSPPACERPIICIMYTGCKFNCINDVCASSSPRGARWNSASVSYDASRRKIFRGNFQLAIQRTIRSAIVSTQACQAAGGGRVSSGIPSKRRFLVPDKDSRLVSDHRQGPSADVSSLSSFLSPRRGSRTSLTTSDQSGEPQQPLRG